MQFLSHNILIRLCELLAQRRRKCCNGEGLRVEVLKLKMGNKFQRYKEKSESLDLALDPKW